MKLSRRKAERELFDKTWVMYKKNKFRQGIRVKLPSIIPNDDTLER